LILIKIEKCGHCFCCIYRDIIEYRDNFLDNNREMIFLISPNPTRSCMCQNPVISLWTSLWACCKYQNPVIWFSWKNKACSWGYRIWYAHEHLIYVPKSCNILMSLVCLYMSILLHDFRVYMNVLMRIPDRFKIIFSFW
jgi:hypothetical protein